MLLFFPLDMYVEKFVLQQIRVKLVIVDTTAAPVLYIVGQ